MTGHDPDRTANAMTVDVEDYFQVSAFEGHFAREDWDRIPCRVEANTDRILQMFADAGAHATFFTLGWVAERYPSLMQRIVAQGHEVGSHGMEHIRATGQSREDFASDIRRSKAILEDATGTPVRGYRAASFSISKDNFWALDEIGAAGYSYSSSIYPVRHDLYGIPDAPRYPFKANGGGVTEIPVTTVRALGQNWPCGGGGYFRLLPYAYFKWAINRFNERDGRSAIFYFHPWEIDAEQPRVPNVSAKTRFRHYTNLAKMQGRLEQLLSDFRWGRMDEVFLRDSVEVGEFHLPSPALAS